MNGPSVLLRRLVLLGAVVALGACVDADPADVTGTPDADDLDAALRSYLDQLGFTGRIASTLEARLGRPIDMQLADIGRLLWFDPIGGLNDDNTCAGCHSPTHGFGDTQPIAIGIDNNLVVGHGRRGPRNQRRSPMVINTVFYPTLMWNSRFNARSGDPFDNSAGFEFPEPEGLSLSYLPHLLTAQAFIPPTERVEAAGFEFPGDNDDIRDEVVRRLNENDEYRARFAQVFAEVNAGGPITYDHVARVIAEFEFTQVYADAPIDRYARGIPNALTPKQKLGAVLFFGRAGCVRCHAVSGESNEMFSDFEQHVAGIPQIVPWFTNMEFDGPGGNEDFGLEQAAASYTTALLPPDLQGPLGPMQPVLERLDPLLRTPVELTEEEFEALVEFVRTGLLDPNAHPFHLRQLIPETLPSGRPGLIFEH